MSAASEGLLERLARIWEGVDHPFLIHPAGNLTFADILGQPPVDLTSVHRGDVVALIGDFDARSVHTLLRLFDLGAIVVPLTAATRAQHDYFLETALVDTVIDAAGVHRRENRHLRPRTHPLLEELRNDETAGLILFSTGTTGQPKAILHDLDHFIRRFDRPNPGLRALSFLLFDHIGGLNTLLQALFNRRVIVAPSGRTVDAVLDDCRRHGVEALPATPTFLRMLLLSGAVPQGVPETIRLITYSTERMDQPTLDALCALLPDVEFRQTFGMSELGIMRVASKARDSLFFNLGGRGVETRTVDNVLWIRTPARMRGYLNAPSPFDSEGWYNTGDIVVERDGFYKVTGRADDVINVGGLKFMAAEVEQAALALDAVLFAKAVGRDNPLTGQHVELLVQPVPGANLDTAELKAQLQQRLPAHMMPRRLRIDAVPVSHRYKLV
ncbi:class I adenylate-forming enzyme family protein [Pseudohoeflea coraliihabitans]|uniref:Fatty acid--CoA ligase family protein n=1 Tax=Pseudohoeflea coraliihabitans TaxID=2860393 RepID=A0ABS6WL34_9HYPH|nr:fatty acid--CoA ligase family protein [Pseudohoeflea sp. DP4N28-3]MBW3096485.1 fatty acid--CoA ligase family protein [Pseudohoeflea sp. DP4N28-3]